MSPTRGQVLGRWVLACAGAETLGMTAAAAAATPAWSLGEVLLLAGATGAVAGAVVGLALGGYVAREMTRDRVRVGEGGHR